MNFIAPLVCPSTSVGCKLDRSGILLSPDLSLVLTGAKLEESQKYLCTYKLNVCVVIFFYQETIQPIIIRLNRNKSFT